MAEINGVCAIIPRHQEGYRPKVIGMGILVDYRELVTCAHVVDAMIGEGWFDQPGDGVVRWALNRGAVAAPGPCAGYRAGAAAPQFVSNNDGAGKRAVGGLYIAR